MTENKGIAPLTVFIKTSLTGMLGLSTVYAILLTLVTKDLRHPIDQFLALQPWMTLLILGFGVQTGLFWLMKKGVHFNIHQKQDAKLAVGTGSAMSGMAMVACCAHHLVEALPILGFSAAALFFSEYQRELLAMGIFANLTGIGFMGWMIMGKPQLEMVANWALSKTIKRRV